MIAPQEIRTFFITSVTAQRRSIFQTDSNSQLLMDILREDQEKERYRVHAFVIMRDHVHLLLTPAEAVSLEKAVQFLKGGFSFRSPKKGSAWERSFTNHRIRDTRDFVQHKNYIEQNPVRAGMVTEASAYPYSSSSRPDLICEAPRHLCEARG